VYVCPLPFYPPKLATDPYTTPCAGNQRPRVRPHPPLPNPPPPDLQILRHIGIYTRILLTLLLDPGARPLPADMKHWADVVRPIKRRARGGALALLTYIELGKWRSFEPTVFIPTLRHSRALIPYEHPCASCFGALHAPSPILPEKKLALPLPSSRSPNADRSCYSTAIWFVMFHALRPDRLRRVFFVMQGWGVHAARGPQGRDYG